MKYSERKKMMEDFNPEQLNGGKGPKELAEGYFRWHVVTLLADIADQLGTTAYAYQEMLKIQQSKSGQSRPSQPASSRPGEYTKDNPAPAGTESRYGNR
jgi:hypothetical protein